MYLLMLMMQDDEKCLSDDEGPPLTQPPPPLPQRKRSEPFITPPPSTNQWQRRPSLPGTQQALQLPPRSRQLPPPLAEEGFERGRTRDAAGPTTPTSIKPKTSLFNSGRRS